jgi:hypothetical protein
VCTNLHLFEVPVDLFQAPAAAHAVGQETRLDPAALALVVAVLGVAAVVVAAGHGDGGPRHQCPDDLELAAGPPVQEHIQVFADESPLLCPAADRGEQGTGAGDGKNGDSFHSDLPGTRASRAVVPDLPAPIKATPQ